MDSGLDKAQWQAVAAWWARTAGDHVKLRFLICVTILAASYVFVLDPLGAELAAARKAHAKALRRENMANELAYFRDQFERFEPRLVSSAEPSDWQNYVLAQLEASGAQLASMEPRGVESAGGFKLVEMEIDVKSTDYAALVDFVDRIEHGARLVRIEKLTLERQPRTLLLTCTLKGLVRPDLEGG